MISRACGNHEYTELSLLSFLTTLCSGELKPSLFLEEHTCISLTKSSNSFSSGLFPLYLAAWLMENWASK